jgi:hypothetical protein
MLILDLRKEELLEKYSLYNIVRHNTTVLTLSRQATFYDSIVYNVNISARIHPSPRLKQRTPLKF